MNKLNARQWREAMKALNVSPQKKAAKKKADLLKKWKAQKKANSSS